MALLATGALVAFPVAPAGASDYPGQDEIDAARQAAEGAAASVSQLDGAIAQLEDALHQADVAARLAHEDHHLAHEASVAAQRRLHEANQRADEADAALGEARRALASVAMTSYRHAGSMGQFEAITRADGFDDVIKRSEVMGRASSDADDRMEEVRAAELVAATTRGYAEKAAVEAEEAADTAEQALETAKGARADAQRAVGDAAAARSAAVNRLAELRGVTAELEQERQDGLAAERRARERAAFEQAQREAEQQAATPPPASGGSGNGNGSGGNGSGGSGSGGSGGSGGNGSGGSGGSGSGGNGSGGNGGSGGSGGSGGNGSGGSGSGGGSTPAPTETPAPQPTNDPAPPPVTSPPPTAWKSSAAQGQRAASHSRTLVGAPYAWGGNGPAYDCSGITSVAWRTAGISIPRTSGSQYAGTTKLAYSELRQGDLVFWGSGRSASAIYHVAIYIGNGQIMEAQTHGKPAQIRSLYSWAVGDMMPYIGRP